MDININVIIILTHNNDVKTTLVADHTNNSIIFDIPLLNHGQEENHHHREVSQDDFLPLQLI